MPTDTIVLLAFIVGAFAIFAGVLVWADRTTHNLPGR